MSLSTKKDINLLPYAHPSKYVHFLERFPTAKHSGELYIRHLFFKVKA